MDWWFFWVNLEPQTVGWRIRTWSWRGSYSRSHSGRPGRRSWSSCRSPYRTGTARSSRCSDAWCAERSMVRKCSKPPCNTTDHPDRCQGSSRTSTSRGSSHTGRNRCSLEDMSGSDKRKLEKKPSKLTKIRGQKRQKSREFFDVIPNNAPRKTVERSSCFILQSREPN